MEPPGDQVLTLSTQRLSLEPIRVDHAAEMVALLSDPALHRFIPSEPPSLESLRELYRRWMARMPPEGDELWLNWAARRRDDDVPIGHFQAGFDLQRDASIAYVVGIQYQRRGYALEALQIICRFLQDTLHARRVQAWIDTRNLASIALVQKLGMRERERIQGADFFKGASSDEIVFELPADWAGVAAVSTAY